MVDGLPASGVLSNNFNRLLIPLFLFILLLVGGLFFLYKSGRLVNLTSLQNVRPTPPTQRSLANVLFPLNPDPTGRDIYYTLQNQTDFRYSGVGVYKLQSGSQFIDENGKVVARLTGGENITDYMVGSFVSWEPIENSPDKYLVLEDKLRTQTPSGDLVSYPKLRVGFSVEHINNKTSFASTLGVEDLDSSIPEPTNQTRVVRLYKIAPIGSLSEEDLNKLIRPGDALAMRIQVDLKSHRDLEDSKGAKIVSWIFIRRFDPQRELSAELERNTELK